MDPAQRCMAAGLWCENLAEGSNDCAGGFISVSLPSCSDTSTCCYKLVPGPMAWRQAILLCQSHGKLVTPDQDCPTPFERVGSPSGREPPSTKPKAPAWPFVQCGLSMAREPLSAAAAGWGGEVLGVTRSGGRLVRCCCSMAPAEGPGSGAEGWPAGFQSVSSGGPRRQLPVRSFRLKVPSSAPGHLKPHLLTAQ